MNIKNLKYTLAVMKLVMMPFVLSSCGYSEDFETPKTAIQTEDSKDSPINDGLEDVYFYGFIPGSVRNGNNWSIYSCSGRTYEIDNKTFIGAHKPIYITNEYQKYSYENGIDTNNLFFIRINGELYLSTKLVDINEDNIITKYYSLEDGEFLGQTLDINWYSRSIMAAIDVAYLEPCSNLIVDEHCGLLDFSINESFLDKIILTVNTE